MYHERPGSIDQTPERAFKNGAGLCPPRLSPAPTITINPPMKQGAHALPDPVILRGRLSVPRFYFYSLLTSRYSLLRMPSRS